MIEIIPELTLLVDTKMKLMMKNYDLQLWQCLGLGHIYIHVYIYIYEHHCLYNSVLKVWRGVQQQYER